MPGAVAAARYSTWVLVCSRTWIGAKGKGFSTTQRHQMFDERSDYSVKFLLTPGWWCVELPACWPSVYSEGKFLKFSSDFVASQSSLHELVLAICWLDIILQSNAGARDFILNSSTKVSCLYFCVDLHVPCTCPPCPFLCPDMYTVYWHLGNHPIEADIIKVFMHVAYVYYTVVSRLNVTDCDVTHCN